MTLRIALGAEPRLVGARRVFERRREACSVVGLATLLVVFAQEKLVSGEEPWVHIAAAHHAQSCFFFM